MTNPTLAELAAMNGDLVTGPRYTTPIGAVANRVSFYTDLDRTTALELVRDTIAALSLTTVEHAGSVHVSRADDDRLVQHLAHLHADYQGGTR